MLELMFCLFLLFIDSQKTIYMSLLNNHLKGKDKKKPAPGKPAFAANLKGKAASTKAAHAAPKQTGGSQRGS